MQLLRLRRYWMWVIYWIWSSLTTFHCMCMTLHSFGMVSDLDTLTILFTLCDAHILPVQSIIKNMKWNFANCIPLCVCVCVCLVFKDRSAATAWMKYWKRRMEKWEKMELHAVIIVECVGHYNGLLACIAVRPTHAWIGQLQKVPSPEREQVTFRYNEKNGRRQEIPHRKKCRYTEFQLRIINNNNKKWLDANGNGIVPKRRFYRRFTWPRINWWDPKWARRCLQESEYRL